MPQTDDVFKALGISEEDQEIEGAKVVVTPKVVIKIWDNQVYIVEGQGKADIQIRDYDVTEDEHEGLEQDENGDKYQLRCH